MGEHLGLCTLTPRRAFSPALPAASPAHCLPWNHQGFLGSGDLRIDIAEKSLGMERGKEASGIFLIFIYLLKSLLE